MHLICEITPYYVDGSDVELSVTLVLVNGIL